jgi:tRNA-splicing ligase RtcB
MFTNHGKNHKEVQLNHGRLHVFANDEVFATFENKVYEMADNILAVPRIQHMSYTPDAHVGVGTCIGTTAAWNMNDGFVSPSTVGSDIGCGMRVHLTSLHKNDLADKALKRSIIRAIEKFSPVGERAASKYADIKVSDIVRDGVHGLPAKYVPDHYTPSKRTWTTNLETDRFGIEKPEYIEDRPDHKHLKEGIWARAWKTIGTLGGGNHFIELQHLEIDPASRATAEKWGLFDGQVVVMIHSGSRAWGGTIGQENTKEFKAHMQAWGVGSADPNLVYAPIDTPAGEKYINQMYSALNYAVANRHMIAYGVLQAFRDVFGANFEMPLLYDLMHNYALKEFHRNRPMMVHRKGATRALPPGHFLNPASYKETGHPVIIPGSMGTASYLLVGRPEGEKNFYSVCHGAGRVRSRSATKQLVTVDEFASSLRVGEDDEILVNHRSLQTILDECPQAYKDIDQIIDSVVGAELASVVAKCHPMVAIKGV